MGGTAAGPRERGMSSGEKRTVALLGVPTMALSLAVTVVTTYLPVAAHEFLSSNVVIGVIVGLEGVVALWLPLVAGTWSDRVRTRLGGRLPFLIAAAPIVVAGLAGLAFARSTLTLAVGAFVFFVGYFLAYEPYRALYPDVVPDEVAGRAQATQAAWRGLGTGIALLGGGLLIAIGPALPFLAAALVFVIGLGTFGAAVARRGVPDQERCASGGLREAARAVWSLVRDRGELQAFLVANALWELSLAALKTFVVLYVTVGMGLGQVTASLLIGGGAVVVLASALAAGQLADRFGHLRVLGLGLPVYGLGFLVPFAFTSPLVVALSLPFIAVGGGIIMALPYAVLMPLMPDEAHGALTGYYSVSRGLGTWLGPLLGGLAVTALAGPFGDTHGYQAVWGVCALAVLLSLIPLRVLRRRAGGGR